LTFQSWRRSLTLVETLRRNAKPRRPVPEKLAPCVTPPRRTLQRLARRKASDERKGLTTETKGARKGPRGSDAPREAVRHPASPLITESASSLALHVATVALSRS
jgi:hypothetical protein